MSHELTRQNSFQPSLLSDSPQAIAAFLDEQFMVSFEQSRDGAEREEENIFHYLTDSQVIYLYLHRKQTARGERQENSKREYLRDISLFYRKLHELFPPALLQEDVKGFREGEYLRNLRPRHIRAFQEWLMKEAGYKATTRSRKIVIIKSLLTWLYNKQYIQLPLHTEDSILSDPVREDDLPDKDLHYNEVKQLITYYTETVPHAINRTLLEFFATTGFRCAEVCNANWKNITYENGSYYISLVVKRGGTLRKQLLPYVFAHIQEMRMLRGQSIELNPLDDSPLFVTSRGTRYSPKYLSKYIKQIIQETNLPFVSYRPNGIGPHHFRHFYVQYSYDLTKDIRRTQRQVGHKQFQTTLNYLEKKLRDEDDVAGLFNQLEF